MKVLQLEDTATETLFQTMFQQRNLVPVLGAGFSKGAPTSLAHVPDTTAFSGTMLKCLQASAGDEANFLSNKHFSEIAEYFLNPDFVPTATAKEIVRRYFIGVKLDAKRKGFLGCPWPYIYTLNIDDAIESNSLFTNKIVPNRNISDAAKTLSCVYKVHGDAAEELLYDEPSKIIFSTGQYVRSLTTNKSMLNSLKTDLTEQNALFVGCSLSNEIDLLFALAEYHDAFPPGRLSIYVSTSIPNKFEAAKLSAHGINTTLVVPDYDTFYREVARWGQRAVQTAVNPLKQWRVVPKDMDRLGLERDRNLSFLLRESDGHQKTAGFTLPLYCIARDIEDAVIRAINEAPLSMIRGRRFSGRTLLLRNVAASAKAREVYFVNSNTRASEEMLNDLLKAKNGLFIFDTNSLTPETALVLAKSLKHFRETGSSALVAVNRTEPDIVGALVRHLDDKNDFELDSRLSLRECTSLNEQLDAIGLFRFECRRTLLDNTYRMLEQYPSRMSELSKSIELNEKEVELLLVISIADKAYSSLATALDLRVAELFAFCDKLAPILDLVDTGKGELRDVHSRYKIVTNSSTGVGIQIRSVVNTRGYPWLADRLGALVKRLISLPQFASTGHSMFMFDAINHVLSQGVPEGSGTGYRPVVRALYEDLQSALNHSPDYWLQRAKAVFNLEDDKARLLDGIVFAMKSYREADRERTIDNAEFLIALLYGKLCSVTRYKDSEYVILAIRWFTKAVNNYNRNLNYVKAMLENSRDRKGYFDQLCDHLEGPISDVALLPWKRDVDYLTSVRRNWKSQHALHGVRK